MIRSLLLVLILRLNWSMHRILRLWFELGPWWSIPWRLLGWRVLQRISQFLNQGTPVQDQCVLSFLTDTTVSSGLLHIQTASPRGPRSNSLRGEGSASTAVTSRSPSPEPLPVPPPRLPSLLEDSAIQVVADVGKKEESSCELDRTDGWGPCSCGGQGGHDPEEIEFSRSCRVTLSVRDSL